MASERVVADEVAALDHWAEALGEVQERVAHRVRRVEVRERARRYLAGLLARVERKNGWQLAEALARLETFPEVCNALKRALDPNNRLSPGRYGIGERPGPR